jgi:hypothetical protein
MTIESFARIVQGIDPDAARYQKLRKPTDKAYTVWSDYGTGTLYVNGVPAGKTKKIQVDYFTLKEDDPVALAFFRAFSENDEITVIHNTDFEIETRYIHHIYDCEMVANYGVV